MTPISTQTAPRSNVQTATTAADADEAAPVKAEAKKDTWEWATRAMGAVKAVGGVVKVGAATVLGLAPDPTLATKAGAVAVGSKAIDDLQTGLRQLVSGKHTKSGTEQVVSATAETLGASKETAQKIGAGADMVAGFAGGGDAKAVAGALKAMPGKMMVKC
jgi:hypothetical protein